MKYVYLFGLGLTEGRANQQNILGDINFDGLLNVIDVVIIIDFCIGNSTPNSSEFTVSDVNGDNEINVLDIVQLVNIILS